MPFYESNSTKSIATVDLEFRPLARSLVPPLYDVFLLPSLQTRNEETSQGSPAMKRVDVCVPPVDFSLVGAAVDFPNRSIGIVRYPSVKDRDSGDRGSSAFTLRSAIGAIKFEPCPVPLISHMRGQRDP